MKHGRYLPRTGKGLKISRNVTTGGCKNKLYRKAGSGVVMFRSEEKTYTSIKIKHSRLNYNEHILRYE